MAQLQLAERIIAEKDHELHEVVAKADQFMMEKEFLEEELATVRTSIGGVTTLDSSVTTATNSTSPPQTRVSVCTVESTKQCLRVKLFHECVCVCIFRRGCPCN